MAYLAVDKDGAEWIYDASPTRRKKTEEWSCEWPEDGQIELPKGSIAKLIGRELTWEDEPVELK
ncbi:MAG: fructan hydrolase [Bacteroidales bacterium]|nr:fructan hydrolase [Bacteroidales bacterium]